MRKYLVNASAALLCIMGSVAQAGDFDGSRPLICATVEAIACSAGTDCEKGIPDDIGAPDFLRIDFVKKVIAGPKRTTSIVSMEKTAEQILLQGNELGYGWTLAVTPAGKMSSTMTNGDGSFVLFGSCTTL